MNKYFRIKKRILSKVHLLTLAINSGEVDRVVKDMCVVVCVKNVMVGGNVGDIVLDVMGVCVGVANDIDVVVNAAGSSVGVCVLAANDIDVVVNAAGLSVGVTSVSVVEVVTAAGWWVETVVEVEVVTVTVAVAAGLVGEKVEVETGFGGAAVVEVEVKTGFGVVGEVNITG